MVRAMDTITTVTTDEDVGLSVDKYCVGGPSKVSYYCDP